jgi:cysteine-rich repeat protein
VAAYCGDGVQDQGEECDDGHENSDTVAYACRTTCRRGTCGDGIRDPGEGCDDGERNSDTVPDACRTNCRPAGCGDGVVDRGEGCDDGEENGSDLPDGCRAGCVAPACGDGTVDTGEECDDGLLNNNVLPDACRTNCRRPYCGDGVVGPGEQCDEGAENDDTLPGACRTTCRNAGCGDGVLDPGEECDEGAANSNLVPNACRRECRFPRCGDGVVDLGEECDDGNLLAPDGCTATCVPALPATCVAPGVPLQDLRAVGTADELGFIVASRLPAGEGEAETASCGGEGKEAVYAFPIPARGDLVVELEPSPATPGFVPVLAVRRSCEGAELECVAGGETSSTLRWIRPDVSPADGAYYVHVDGATREAGEYTLRVYLRPPLTEGAACAVDGSRGRCQPGQLGCADPDGDGTGTCVFLRPQGAACDPAGATDLCREPAICRDGTCASSCGDGIRQPWEACDDGNLDDQDGCTAECEASIFDCSSPADVTARWNPELGRATWTGTTEGQSDHVRWLCGTTTGVDVVGNFVAPTAGTYSFTLESGGSSRSLAVLTGCSPSASPLLCLGGGYSRPVQGNLELQAGEEVVLVIDESAYSSGGPFSARVELPTCGDGVVQGAEECDDGNAVDTDACRSDCTFPGEDCSQPFPIRPSADDPMVTWSGSFATYVDDYRPSCAASVDRADAVLAFTAPTTGIYSFTGIQTSGAGFYLSVRVGSCTTGVDLGCRSVIADQAPSWIVVPLVEGTTAWAIVDAETNANGFRVEVGPVVCGDGHRIRPEHCDDGNVVSGDGCDENCRIEPVEEIEPNDVRSQAQPLAPGAVLRGSLGIEDLDYVAVDLVAGQTYKFETYLGGWELCERDLSGTTLRLHGPGGELLATDRTAGIGGCARLTYTAPVSGTYYLRVEEYVVGARPIPAGLEEYLLSIALGGEP